jgi:predicted Fe-S protein YdhL (DUF1289 family)
MWRQSPSLGSAVTTYPVSPCIGICIIDPASGFCRGCARTLLEIAGWFDYPAEEKRRIIEALARRQRKLDR